MLANEDFWDDLLGHLKQRVLVPIVGPELVTVEDGERRVMLVRRIAERLVERSQLKIDWTPEPCLDEAIAAYLAAKGRDQSERLYRVVNDILAELAPAPPESLTQLAAIRDFRLFVSTTFDATLARAIDQVRFGGAARTRELAFAPSQSSAEQQANAKPSPDDREVVLRLFGASSSMPQYALHEEDALEWMHALVSDPARLPEWLGFKLRQNPLLIVGCPFSDWVGRALTRLMSDTRLSLAGKQFFIVGANLRQRRRMDKFFHTFCSGSRVQVLEADPAAVRRRASRTLARADATDSAGVGVGRDRGRASTHSRKHLHQLRPRGCRRGPQARRHRLLDRRRRLVRRARAPPRRRLGR